MQPRDSFAAAAKERFSDEPPFSTVLTGMANFATVTASALAGALPVFEYAEASVSADAPAAARNLLSYIGNIERIGALVEWWASNRQVFANSWNALKGIADPEGKFPADSMEGKLASLEAALEKAAPLDDLTRALNDAATAKRGKHAA